MDSVKKNKREQIPELFAEAFALSEMSEAEAKELGQSELVSRRLEIEKSNAEILQRLPAERMVPAIQSRYAMEKSRLKSQKRKSAIKWSLYGIFAPAVCTAVILLWMQPDTNLLTHSTKGPAEQETVRIKGLKPYLAIYRKTEKGIEQLTDGAPAKAGDLIQIAYMAVEQKFGVIISIDGAGSVSLHYPQQVSDSTLLVQKKETLLQRSYELDAAPMFERFIFVTSDQPIDVTKVLKSAELLSTQKKKVETQKLTLPKNWRQNSYILTKVNP